MVFVVAVLRRRRQPRHTVGVAALVVTQRHAHQRRATLPEALLQQLPIAWGELGQLVGQQRHGGFRRNDEVGPCRHQLTRHPGQGFGHAVGCELLVLRNVGLQQRHLQCSSRPGEFGRHRHRRQQHGQRRGQRQRSATHASAVLCSLRRHREAGGQRSHQGADAVDADPGRQCGQRCVHHRVARRYPRKAGEQQAAGQFCQQPQRREKRHISAAAATPLRIRCASSSQIQRQCSRQGKHRRARQRHGQAAVVVQADKQPPGAGAQPSRAVAPAQQRRAAWPGGIQPPHQQHHRGQRQGPQHGVHERQGLQRAQGRHSERLQPPQPRRVRLQSR